MECAGALATETNLSSNSAHCYQQGHTSITGMPRRSNLALQYLRPVLEAPWESCPFYIDGKKKINAFWQEHHVFLVLPFKHSNDAGWTLGEVVG